MGALLVKAHIPSLFKKAITLRHIGSKREIEISQLKQSTVYEVMFLRSYGLTLNLMDLASYFEREDS